MAVFQRILSNTSRGRGPEVFPLVPRVALHRLHELLLRKPRMIDPRLVRLARPARPARPETHALGMSAIVWKPWA